MGAAAGHYWTFRPYLDHILRPVVPPASRHFRAVFQDPKRGEVSLSGRFTDRGPNSGICIIVHGLGGNCHSHYVIRAAREADALGFSTLRLNLRGADRSGVDIYHAGLTDDLRAALSAPSLAAFREVFLLGFSLGGHLVLRYLAEVPDPRLRAAASVCAPIDLAAGAKEIDRPHRYVYRSHVLRGLKEIYAATAIRRGASMPVSEAMRIDTIRAWDENIVAPRFGFQSADDYWARTTVMPLLDRIDLPTLAITASHDPMVLAHTVLPALERARNMEIIHVSSGGHVGFPTNVDLGLHVRGTIERQVLTWLRKHGRDLPHLAPPDVDADDELR